MTKQTTKIYLLGSVLLLAALIGYSSGAIGLVGFAILFFGVVGFVSGFRAGYGCEEKS